MLPAIVLAAGLSRRMGRFKLTLPWGQTTVIGQVVVTLTAAGVNDITVVTGHRAAEVEAALAETAARTIHNPDYATGEMLSSIQAGVRAVIARRELHPLAQKNEGQPQPTVLLCLGDQPQMQVDTVRSVLVAGEADGWARIVIPSYQMRAGHPILLPAWLWPEILTCTSTLRDVMTARRAVTRYLVVETPSVLADLDTPEDYRGAG